MELAEGRYFTDYEERTARNLTTAVVPGPGPKDRTAGRATRIIGAFSAPKALSATSAAMSAAMRTAPAAPALARPAAHRRRAERESTKAD